MRNGVNIRAVCLIWNAGQGWGYWWVPHSLCLQATAHSFDARNWILVWPKMLWIIFTDNKLDTSTFPRFLCDILGVICVVKCHECWVLQTHTHTQFRPVLNVSKKQRRWKSEVTAPSGRQREKCSVDSKRQMIFCCRIYHKLKFYIVVVRP